MRRWRKIDYLRKLGTRVLNDPYLSSKPVWILYRLYKEDNMLLWEEVLRTKDPDAAIDKIINTFDDLLCEDRFVECDDLLRAADVSVLSSSHIVAILSVTLPAKRYLSYRTFFVEKARKVLKPSLLVGLE